MAIDCDGISGGIAGDDGIWELWEAGGEASLVEEGRDVGGGEGAIGEGLGDGTGEVLGAVAVEETEELVDLGGEGDATASDLLQEGASLWRKGGDPVAATGAAGCGLVVGHGLEVGGLLREEAAVP
ncbi:MAG TPA: hypothetical protein PKM13_06315 [Candidatus Bipolaricaulis anaerobius]|nr:hypothetical protein [Candidatus Bipolaricaulis anaerobius]